MSTNAFVESLRKALFKKYGVNFDGNTEKELMESLKKWQEEHKDK